MTTRPTMAAVAEAAGVSVSTVSRVLADKPDISEETRVRVTQAAHATGYLQRKGRRKQLGGILDVLIEGTTSPWAGELIAGAQHAAFSLGYTLALTATGHPRFRVSDWIDARRTRPSDGILLVLSRARHDEIAALAGLPAPLVLLDPVGTSEPTIPTVGATNWSGGAAATRHLLELGHRRVGFIGGPAEIQCTRERHEGYLAAHREFSLAPDPALTHYGDFSVTSGTDHGAALLDLPQPPTAIFAGSDAQAAGVYQVARARGMRVPDDLSVVGFDDTVICTMLAPPLTTVRQPLAEMGGEGVRLIAQEQSRHGSSVGRRIELATSLVARESTAPRAAHDEA
ncbi:LacI family DNA-binding transcriptional regulator [Streptomyces sp. ME19-01-6]|uniref:LacI family DNA-binding transcriptional regulator n=1 Tax=Streptomyces sp. ME19-01-6 TaxID=3028686 RepID=UPI0029A9611C|nr:LacI family DNA-binding transcriptional regulator [Streptomyces sp. ME19-01-6]MDX3227909.1 LacI family DNA-binding transcriptional regulator [Streptomyces sp. ME19-01-6]